MTQMSQMTSKKVIAKAENGKGIELQVIKGNEAKNKQLQGKEMLYQSHYIEVPQEDIFMEQTM